MQFKCRIVAVSLLALLAAASCAELEQPVPEETSIAFSAVVSGDMPATRASGMISNDADLQDEGFGVFGCYTGLHNYSESDASSSFMYNQQVEWVSGDSRWEYDPVKYWPGEEGHKVSFFAYAPYSAGDGTGCIPSYVRYQEKGDPWIMYRIADNVDDQVDLLYAAPLLDQTRPAVNERLEFNFKHALACVGEKVTLDCSDALVTRQKSDVDAGTIDEASYILKSMKIKYVLTAKGRLNLWNKGVANWTPIQSEDVLTTRTVTLFSGETYFLHYKQGDSDVTKGWSDQDHGVFCIPVEASGYPQKVIIEMDYKILRSKGGAVVTETDRSVSSELLLQGRIQEGKTLDINITLTNE